MELILTGSRLSAQRALELGLVNRVVAADRVLPAALELAHEIANNAPAAVRAARAVARGGG